MTISGKQTRRQFVAGASAFGAISFLSLPASAGAAAFVQGVVEAAAGDRTLATFYRESAYQPLWTGNGMRARARRQALIEALGRAGEHGLPQSTYESALAKLNLRGVRSQRDLGRIEVGLSDLFLRYARDIQTGVLNPQRVDKDIHRKVPLRDPLVTLANFSKSSPAAYMRSLAPQSREYVALMKHKFALERVIARGGWGAEVPVRKMQLGDSGPAVIALRDRLIAMGYLRRSASPSFDERLQRAVQAFQTVHGLAADGVAGKGTLSAINVSAERRLASIVTAMERERWMNMPRGKRHIWVNLTDFTAAIVDDGRITFKTRSVVGANVKDRRSPEFSDMMEYMEINPTWNVPKSIAVKEYLPKMQEDPYAVSYLKILDENGQEVSRDAVDFTKYGEEDFPFDLKQPPSGRNALGLVKFMFPNKYNIYLHDTPEKHLFARERRAFSHGCIRLRDPFDFAYELLRRQVADPVSFFKAKLATGEQQIVYLKEPVPVHLVYRTAFADAKGRLNFRADIYGRDAKIFAALWRAGVVLRGVQS